MTIWIAETGTYSNRGIAGVYATLDAAKANHPIPTDPRILKQYTVDSEGWKQRYNDGAWDNGLSDDYACEIQSYEVQP